MEAKGQPWVLVLRNYPYYYIFSFRFIQFYVYDSFLLTYMYVFQYVHRRQKRLLDYLELELQMVVSHVGTGNGIWGLSKEPSL